MKLQKGTVKLIRKSFEIVEVPAYLYTANSIEFAVHHTLIEGGKQDSTWAISHVETGRSVVRMQLTRESAIIACEKLIATIGLKKVKKLITTADTVKLVRLKNAIGGEQTI